ncbi:hypothetical protein HK103_002983 [Boothiomyces macroporosus]|uniref:Mediator complex subunit 15 KIX domain-containing protein n=1 Tax=Boothiomyces macroporosus TaxID=261099 RepID=A0AAD5UIH0_9FUNG|nr:hypothetical protein HK103_002983 [Boothiomyces macroporosus]
MHMYQRQHLDWRAGVNDAARNEIVNKLFNAACEALPPDQRTQVEKNKLQELAKGYEKNIFEKSNSQPQMNNLAPQMTGIPAAFNPLMNIGVPGAMTPQQLTSLINNSQRLQPHQKAQVEQLAKNYYAQLQKQVPQNKLPQGFSNPTLMANLQQLNTTPQMSKPAEQPITLNLPPSGKYDPEIVKKIIELQASKNITINEQNLAPNEKVAISKQMTSLQPAFQNIDVMIYDLYLLKDIPGGKEKLEKAIGMKIILQQQYQSLPKGIFYVKANVTAQMMKFLEDFQKFIDEQKEKEVEVEVKKSPKKGISKVADTELKEKMETSLEMILDRDFSSKPLEVDIKSIYGNDSFRYPQLNYANLPKPVKSAVKFSALDDAHFLFGPCQISSTLDVETPETNLKTLFNVLDTPTLEQELESLSQTFDFQYSTKSFGKSVNVIISKTPVTVSFTIPNILEYAKYSRSKCMNIDVAKGISKEVQDGIKNLVVDGKGITPCVEYLFPDVKCSI